MNEQQTFWVKIDQLPEEAVQARDAKEAALKVRDLLNTRESLQGLHSDEPVQLKKPDGRPWGRNLSIAHYKTNVIETRNDDGPVAEPTVQRL